MKIGYPCVNLGLECRSSGTFRLASYSDARMKETVASNLACLGQTLRYNADHGMLFFRITSDLIPFASHEVCTFPWQEVFAGKLRSIGRFIRGHHFRISMHPDQFVLINSVDEKIFMNSLNELSYHADVLDLLGLGQTAKIQIHAGGVYGDKAASMDRFVRRYRSLPANIRRRLVIENDDRLYSLADCMSLHAHTGVPVLFDAFHFSCNSSGERLRDAVRSAARTWADHDGVPMVDYSSQQKGKRPGTHARTIDMRDFRKFLRETDGFDFDIMLEIKDKEKSALRALRAVDELRSGGNKG